MKKLLCIAFSAHILTGCSPPTSSETTSQDSVAVTTAPVDSLVAVVPPKEDLAISDSTAVMIRDIVNARFEAFYADTTQLYRVEYYDYYDEWEGQATMTKQTWYLDKDFSVVYYGHSFEAGTTEKPYSEEYLLENTSLLCSKGEAGGENMSWITNLWDASAGGVQIKETRVSSKDYTYLATPKAYSVDLQKAASEELYIPSELLERKPDISGDTYTLLKQVPKQAELTDYTKAILPKAVYDKLRKGL